MGGRRGSRQLGLEDDACHLHTQRLTLSSSFLVPPPFVITSVYSYMTNPSASHRLYHWSHVI
jgi:hypothetical protein